MIENRFVTRMLVLDPNYGSQAHQWLFVQRLDRWQSLQPCNVDHEHETACYSEVTRAQVAAELAPPMQHALPLSPLVVSSDASQPAFTQSELEGGGLW